MVEAEHQTMTAALVEPRSPLDLLGPLRGSSKFSSPLWQAHDRGNAPSAVETLIEDISVPAEGPSPEQENGLVADYDAGLGADYDAGLVAEDDAGPGADFDAPTETFRVVLDADATGHGPSVTADPKPRSFPWPPSPWPRSTTAPTVRIRVADLLSRTDESLDLTWDDATAANQEPAVAATAPAPVKVSHAVNARTLVLAAVASVVVLCVGALFVGPMGAVTIAPDAGPITAASGARHVSGASVMPAVLSARSPASAYPASIEKLDAPRTNPVAKPTGPAGDAAMSAIPGMMGTPVPLSTPGRVSTHSNAPATALSTAARSSDSDRRAVNPAGPRSDLARGDHTRAYEGDGPTDAFGGDHRFDDAARTQGPDSGLVSGLVGGVLN